MQKKRCFQVTLTAWYLLLMTKISEVVLTSCNVSLPTLQMVSMCPTTEEELEKATKRKDCKSLAEIQTCVPPGNFTYHCVINDFANETYEVCAPAIYSQGRCLEFDQHGRRIEELNINCVPMGCPKKFRSANLLSYGGCSKIVKHKGNKSTTYLSGDCYWNALSIILAAICGVLFLLLSLVLGILCRKMKQENHRGLQFSEETTILNGEESTANAIQKITEDYDSRKRRKGKGQIPQHTKLLTTSTLSIKSSESHVTVKQGFDAKTFTFFLKRHNLQDCKRVLYRNKIDCLQTFFELDEEKLTSFGLDYGQVLKCLRAKKTIQTESRV
ncbi:uncharacterized protein LOC133186410 [Saccostrea echinata]|uniref:uncharacterized protein LOC133186410 n=1 Tax=Saccostrea echinata TaxID=191078 RepID=UPI002A81BDC1|nr:uncharacterized protein LOC133186410 [Saccostrea echinata]